MNENRQYVAEEPESTSALSAASLGSLNMLSPEQIVFIDHALSELGAFGEVRLIKAKGKLRFIQVVESKSAL